MPKKTKKQKPKEPNWKSIATSLATDKELAEQRVAQLEAALSFFETPAIHSVVTELSRARATHPTRMNSAHEGFAVLDEVRDELWELVKLNAVKAGIGERHRREAMREEAVQIGAMALRFIEDVCDGKMVN
jgi:hypothetical protein